MFNSPALIVSSIGDLDRLDLLTSFMPSTTHLPSDVFGGPSSVRQNLEVTETVLGVRHHVGTYVVLVWTFRGRLHAHFSAGRRHMRPETLELFASAFEDWVDVAVAVEDSA